MEKIKVKTTGNFMLMDTLTGAEMVFHEARLVPKTQFVIDRLELKQLVAAGGSKPKDALAPELELEPEPAPAPNPTPAKEPAAKEPTAKEPAAKPAAKSKPKAS